jgi:pyruvate ferredoxin oxidoreductase gamma subunit/2-oxoisovalerate ferredoxin oxidoreductase gamma subunit
MVTAGDLIARGAVQEGLHAMSMPSFGVERRGAPARCFVRISETPIMVRCDVTHADILCMCDSSIWRHYDFLANIQENALLIFNTPLSAAELEKELRNGQSPSILKTKHITILTTDATTMAMEKIGRPITNTALIGAIAASTSLVSLDTVKNLIREHFGPLGEANSALAEAAYNEIAGQMGGKFWESKTGT